ncbi:MAG TPA: hypothetical protein VEZ14_00175 [Dehalococcoidia bacterium]|nr:hypothetical protein [Dehalococcoidia bacterium]
MRDHRCAAQLSPSRRIDEADPCRIATILPSAWDFAIVDTLATVFFSETPPM